MKKAFSLFLITALLFSLAAPCRAVEFSEELNCRSAILIEAGSGTVLYEKNADQPLPPASVTKIMTLLLVCEALDSGKVGLGDVVPVSENASKMGGSQVYLKVGEEMTLQDMLKSVVVSSANDCAVALAEYIAGSEIAFVSMMNEHAEKLGMKNTNFENVTGLDDTVKNHVSSARDIAIMSAELLKHAYITQYTTIWMDTIRDGQFGLTNTNRLIRFYKGCNGLKTGMTAKAGYCVSATAERGGMQLIAVIMGSPSRDIRNEAASRLLDFGFANYGVYSVKGEELPPLKLTGSLGSELKIRHGDFSVLLPSSDLREVIYETHLPDHAEAPLKEGDEIGRIEFFCRGKPVGEVAITACGDAPRIGYGAMLARMLSHFLMLK
ncbi:MAG: D-alanyl-D-alanine carboxypeptidase [Clostridia bacterium]|nr:D-alanyl-D-alanine carboxypeptidase [Clostridia bacterium]